jgi:putative redox protein
MAIGEYKGDLRTEAKHLRSGQAIITDAPVDNMGKGEAFSPTDLVCAALSSCMMTIMGQVADREGIDLRGLRTEIVKVMASNPRKIAPIWLPQMCRNKN